MANQRFQSAGAAHAQGPHRRGLREGEPVSIRWRGARSGTPRRQAQVPALISQSASAAHAQGHPGRHGRTGRTVSIRLRGARPGTRDRNRCQRFQYVPIRLRGARPGTPEGSGLRHDRHVSIRLRGARPGTRSYAMERLGAKFQSACAAHAQGPGGQIVHISSQFQSACAAHAQGRSEYLSRS